jgi:putative membrane protein
MSILWSWLVLSISIGVTATLLPSFELKGVWNTIKIAALFGILHWLLGWLIFVVIGVGTLGIGFLLAFVTRWIVTAIVLKITDALSTSLSIKSFGSALIGAFIMSAVGTVLEFLVKAL